MRTTFCRFNKGLFLKVHCCTIVYYIIFNCGSLTKFSLILEDLLRRSSGNLIFDLWLWTAHTSALETLFSRPSFYDISCFSSLSSGPHLNATNTSDNIFGSSSNDAITFIYCLFIYLFVFPGLVTLSILQTENLHCCRNVTS